VNIKIDGENNIMVTERIRGARVKVVRYANKDWAVRFRRTLAKGEEVKPMIFTNSKRRIMETRVGLSRDAMLAVQACVLTIMELEGKGTEVLKNERGLI
jgi:hypothetical protein